MAQMKTMFLIIIHDHNCEKVPGVGRHAPLGPADADDGGRNDTAHAVPLPLQCGVEDGALFPARFAYSPIANPVAAAVVGLVLGVNSNFDLI